MTALACLPYGVMARSSRKCESSVQVPQTGKTWPLGPAPSASERHLYIADMGNNGKDRTNLAVYRVAEPQLANLNLGQRLDSEAAEKLPFRYPDGNFDAEALVVDPDTANIYIVTKVEGSAGVYRFPSLTSTAEQTLERIGSVNWGSLVTAADVGQAPLRLLVRTYQRVLEFAPAAGTPFEDIFFGGFRVLPSAAVENKSESICYDRSGRDYLTTNESIPAPLHRYYLREPQALCTWDASTAAVEPFVRGDILLEGDPSVDGINIADVAELSAVVAGSLRECLLGSSGH